MDAYPLLARIAQLFDRHGLEAVLIGNAAAALQGAPVTTVEFDFFFRRTPANMRKLKSIAAELQAVLMKPHYPVSSLLRISRDETGCNLTSWAKSMAYAPSKACASAPWKCHWARRGFWWRDLLISSRARRRPAGRATSPYFLFWRRCLKKPRVNRKARLEALKKESDLAERDLIRRLLALPPEKRTHFLRKRVGIRMSCL